MRWLAPLLAALLLTSLSAVAREGTPGAFPVTSDPAECRTTLPTAAEIDALASGGFASPTAAEDARRRDLRGPSEPAPADAVAGVEATASEFAACLGAGDDARLFGLYSDDLMAGIGVTSDQLDDQIFPLPDGQRTALLAVIEPRIFADGRVGAIVVIADPRVYSPAVPEFLVFVEQDGRWLIDDLPVYFPVPAADGATPVAGQGGDRGWGMSVPDPSECQIAARDFDDLIALEGTPDFGPGAPDRPAPPVWPESEAADAESVAGIVRTVRELVACGNIGEPLRAAALYTDGFISNPYTSLNLPEGGTVSTAPDLDESAAVSVHYARDFGDGRVGAVMAVDSVESASPVYPAFFIFERVGDRWLISEWPSTSSIEDSGDVTTMGPTMEAILVVTPTPATGP